MNTNTYKYNAEYEDQGGYVVNVYDGFESEFIRCLFFASKQEALDFIKSN